jgi:hypothetical protein
VRLGERLDKLVIRLIPSEVTLGELTGLYILVDTFAFDTLALDNLRTWSVTRDPLTELRCLGQMCEGFCGCSRATTDETS